jgi:radical SAM superfamily enzyme
MVYEVINLFNSEREVNEFKQLVKQAKELNVKVCSDALVDFKKAREEVKEITEEVLVK